MHEGDAYRVRAYQEDLSEKLGPASLHVRETYSRSLFTARGEGEWEVGLGPYIKPGMDWMDGMELHMVVLGQRSIVVVAGVCWNNNMPCPINNNVRIGRTQVRSRGLSTQDSVSVLNAQDGSKVPVT